MSNETDRLVSDAYNELANERTPDALNREVLRLAAKEGRTRYSVARGWMRPAAWAATIGLSLVVVLELANMPESDMAPLPQSAPIDAAATPEESDRSRDGISEESMLESEAREERQEALAKRSRPYSPQEQKAEKVAILKDAPAVSQPSLVPMVAEPAPQALAERSVDSDFAPRAEAATEETARSASRADSLAAGITSLRAQSDYLCPADARLSAEKWLKCIQELEASSRPELVEKEYEELRKNFPNFEHPAADR